MRHQAIDPSLFTQNRQRFARQMKPDSLAIFHSNDAMPRNGDQHFPYRQHSDFFYLTGIHQKDSVLILFPDAPRKEFREVLFIKKSNERSKIWEGEKLSKDEASTNSAIIKVVWLSQYQAVLHDLIKQAKRVYINGNESQGAHDEVLTKDLRLGNELMKRYPMHKYHRAQPVLRNLRMIKSPIEVDLIRKALNITKIGFEKVLAGLYPGIWEYQIEAILTGTFIHEGSQGHAYEPIVASGSSACVLHYIANDRKCQSGDLVLLDFGAEYANYAADISRTIPVNGRFNERQAQVYKAVLKVLNDTKEMMVPGILLEELNLEVGKMMNHALVDLGLLDKSDLEKKENKNQPYRQYFMHGVAHHLGLDVHDLSDRYSPFQAGMILTCEPAIYIQDEDLGVRLENNILITDEGPVDLAADVPIEIDEIETMMQTSNRREFLSKVAASGLLIYGSNKASFASTDRTKLPISCNTYNWTTFFQRQGLQWGKDLDFCIRQFKQSGITAIEPAFSDPDEVRKIQVHLDKHGIAMPSAYVNSLLHEAEAAEKSVENVLAIANELKNSNTKILVTNPSPIAWGKKVAKNDSQIKLQTEKLDELGQHLRELGMTLAYHTHDSELLAGGKEFHHVLQNTDPNHVSFCLDAHWVFRGCENSDLAVFDAIKMYGNRIVELHIRQSKGGIWTETFGAGDIDYFHMADVFVKNTINPHLVIEQAVENGTPHTLDAIAAHKINLQKVQEIFSGIL